MLRNLQGLRMIWLEPRATPQYYPLVHTTFWMEYRLWGLAPVGYHATNILLHSFNAFLFWLVLNRLNVPGALFGAAIFCAHPVNVESVAWVTERKNVLSGAFYLLALLAYLRFALPAKPPAAPTPEARSGKPNSPNVPAARRNWGMYALAAGLFVCALLSKTVTATLPAAVLLILWWRRPKVRWRDVWPLLPLLAMGAVMGLLTAWLEVHHVGAEGQEWRLSLLQRVLLAGQVVWFYAAKLVCPTDLAFTYHRWEIDPGAWWQWLGTPAVIAVACALWVARKRIGKAPLAAGLYFVGSLFPVLGFLSVYPMRYAWVADHFQYFAGMGLIALFSGLACVLGRRVAPARRQVRLAAGAALVAGLAFLTYRQAGIYKDAETLWRDTLAKNPDCWLAHTILGNILFHRNKPEEALAHHRAALRAKPDAIIYNNLGLVLAKQGQTEAAIEAFDRALALRADYADPYANRGAAFAQSRQYERALADFDKALQLKPYLAEVYYNRGGVYDKMGRYNHAIGDYTCAIELKEDYAKAYNNRGIARWESGRRDEALMDFTRAIELQGDFAEAYHNRANALAALGRYDQAIRDFTKVIELEPDGPAYYSRAVAFFFAKAYDQAWADIAACRKLGLDPDAGFLKALSDASGRPQR